MQIFDHNSLFILLKELLPDNPTIIEAGAFTGKDSKRLAQTWPNGTIHSFEPDPVIFAQLKKETKDIANIHCYPLALAEKNGTATFWPSQHPKKPDRPSQAGSLLEPKERLTWSNITFKQSIEVKTITLTAWAKQHNISDIDLLWLDLQGAELPVLKASKDLLQKVSYILTEVHFIEAYKNQAIYPHVKAWLEQEGFQMIGKDFTEEPTWFFGNGLFSQVKKS